MCPSREFQHDVTDHRWTHFMDMSSGGSTKVPPYEHIYIEAVGSEAESIFMREFGRDPHNVTCTCCGPDYDVSSGVDLETITRFERTWRGGDAMPVEEYIEDPTVLVLRRSPPEA